MGPRAKLSILLVVVASVLVGYWRHANRETVRRWDEETVHLAATLPMQEGGRVKPLQTYAGFRLLHLNGKRSLELESGEKLEPTGFLLDCWFFPERAKRYECFVVSNSEVLDAIGVESKARRARYSYEELAPGRSRLTELAMRSSEKDSKNLVDNQILSLFKAMRGFEADVGTTDLARLELDVPEGVLTDVLGRDSLRGVSDLMSAWPRVVEGLRAMEGGVAEAEIHDFLGVLRDRLNQAGNAPAIFPPETPPAEREQWLNPSDALYQTFIQEVPVGRTTGWMANLEGMLRERNDREAFRAELRELHDGVVGEARRRGEYGSIESEVAYYDAGLILKALVFFLLAFVLAAFSWLFARSRWIARGSVAVSVLATAVLTAAIVWRSVLRGRPPVLNLYDTILFITAVACASGLVIEAINRKRVGLSLTPILGALGMFLAFRYEVKDAVMNGDTIVQLQAVLDTNFWLATHVTTVTAGYAAGLIATVISVAWIGMRVLGVKRKSPGFYRDITKMAYGAICFGLVLSAVGTILGGIWANYSWGRFWGWDPKENGALLICLVQLFIIHARLGGYIRQHGLHALSCVLGAVVCFSWWGVNELEAGLHSYGRTEGVMFYLMITWGFLGLMAALSGVQWLIERGRAQSVAPAVVGGGESGTARG